MAQPAVAPKSVTVARKAPDSHELPDAEQFIRNITRGALEVLAGVRSVDQMTRWFGEDAFRKLVTRANLSARARSARGLTPSRPVFEIGTVRMFQPSEAAVEATVIVTTPGRTRAVALRLDEFNGRWRVTTIAIL